MEWKIPGECMLLFQFGDLAMRAILIGPRRIAHWSSAMQHTQDERWTYCSEPPGDTVLIPPSLATFQSSVGFL